MTQGVVMQADNSALNTQLRDDLQHVQQLRRSLDKQLTAGALQRGAQSQSSEVQPGSAAGHAAHQQRADSTHRAADGQQQQQQQQQQPQQTQVLHVQCSVAACCDSLGKALLWQLDHFESCIAGY
jgi:hypothetical protein